MIVRDPDRRIESRHDTVTEAIRAAIASDPRADVWLHSENCDEGTQELGPACPCRPFRVYRGKRP